MKALIFLFIFFSPYFYGSDIPIDIEKAIEGIVKIKSTEKQGTGFFIVKDTLVTNAHIITNQNGLIPIKHIQIEQIGHQRNTSVRITGIQALSFVPDLSLLQVEGYHGPVLSLGKAYQERKFI